MLMECMHDHPQTHIRLLNRTYSSLNISRDTLRNVFCQRYRFILLSGPFIFSSVWHFSRNMRLDIHWLNDDLAIVFIQRLLSINIVVVFWIDLFAFVIFLIPNQPDCFKCGIFPVPSLIWDPQRQKMQTRLIYIFIESDSPDFEAYFVRLVKKSSDARSQEWCISDVWCVACKFHSGRVGEMSQSSCIYHTDDGCCDGIDK